MLEVGKIYGSGKFARTIIRIVKHDIWYTTANSNKEKVCFVTTFEDWVKKQENISIQKEINTKQLKEVLNYYDNGRTAKTKDTLGGEVRISGHRVSLSTLIFWLKDMSIEEVIEDSGLTREEIENAIKDVCAILELL